MLVSVPSLGPPIWGHFCVPQALSGWISAAQEQSQGHIHREDRARYKECIPNGTLFSILCTTFDPGPWAPYFIIREQCAIWDAGKASHAV